MSTTPETMGLAPKHLSFREVFDAELAFVCRALRRLGVREADLGDVAQEIFLTVHTRFGEYDQARPIRTWLYAFCLRYASNYRRLARHRDEELGDREHRAPGDRTDAALARDLVLRALESLDFDRRSALVFHDMEGLSAPEIAHLTSAPLNTVYSRLRLAREDFRRALETLNAGAAR